MCKKPGGRWVHVGIVSHGEGYVLTGYTQMKYKTCWSWLKRSKLNTRPKNVQSLYLYFSG